MISIPKIIIINDPKCRNNKKRGMKEKKERKREREEEEEEMEMQPRQSSQARLGCRA